MGDFFVGTVVKNLPANEGNTGSIPGLGRFHMLHVDQLSPSTSVTKPACLEPMLCHKSSHRNEEPIHRKKEELLLTSTRESPLAAMKTQHNQK